MSKTKDPITITHPYLVEQWHPTRNRDLKPNQVTAGSNKKAWWQCPEGLDHEWEVAVAHRAQGKGCPFCAGRRASVLNSLASLHPELAKQWHPTRNGDLTPDQVVAGSHKKVWWLCPMRLDHEWPAIVDNRVRVGSGCPYCTGRNASAANSLAMQYPELAKKWHPAKNGNLTPDQITAKSDKKVWWICSKGPDHEWEVRVANRAKGSGCPFCAGLKVSITNSLASLHPELAKQWHPTKNGDLKPDQVTAGNPKKVWWLCPQGPDHEWPAAVSTRTRGNGCPYCAGKSASITNSLASLYPELAKQWHPTKNGKVTPEQVVAGSGKKYWWKCPEGPDHAWETSAVNRMKHGSGCPYCAGREASITNSLASLHPELAKQWHPTRNGDLTASQVPAGSARKVWWQCPEEPEHEWETRVESRTRIRSGCPYCNLGWTLSNIRSFVKSLQPHLHSFTPAELYLLFQQNGLLRSEGKGKAFIKALVTGRFPQEEVDKFVNGEPSLVDQFVDQPDTTLEGIWEDQNLNKTVIDEAVDEDETELPSIATKDVLSALDTVVTTSADEEAVSFLLASAKAKLWTHAFRNEAEAVAQAEAYAGDEYAEQVRTRFLQEYHAAKSLCVPKGYAFKPDGHNIALPNLMQRLVAVRVRDERRVGNWSGTGAGKTLAAVLASRVIGAGLTVICCPNSVVDGWCEEIRNIFPDSRVATKTFSPEWYTTGFESMNGVTHRYLVLNYEAFQQRDSAARVRSLVERERIDFIVIDEIHFTKQRHAEEMSKRKQHVNALIAMVEQHNPNLAVLGMSATPVINNLQEGKSLVEMVTSMVYNDLETRATVGNCMRLHQRLATLGIRWLPAYQQTCVEDCVDVDCTEYLNEIRALGKTHSPLDLEKILTCVRLPIILEQIRPKTLLYTHYISDIDQVLRDALEAAGWKTGFYTGEDKTGLNDFIHGDLDVLIGSSAIGTGVDGLQQVCNRLIINVLPWTHAAYEQLLGRIYRQGQVQDTVSIIIPVTHADVNGERWSWCDAKLRRIRFKKSIADAAVDGMVPEGHLRTPAQAYQDVMGWLERLERGEISVIERPKIVVPLPDTDPEDIARRRRYYGDFATMNASWNRNHSSTTHQRLQRNPEEWQQYHTLYREARKDWAVIPYKEIIRWCQKRSDYVIGDFGCGEAKLAEALSNRHTTHSFDHVAINDDVTACDMAHVPLEEESLDVAVFSLSLMGSNVSDYVREAHRTLKLDGWLHIIEATSRFSDREKFVASLKTFGFDVIETRDLWKFTHIRAIKADRKAEADAQLAL